MSVVFENRKSRFAHILIFTLMLSIFGGRWVSYIGIPGTPIFLCDFLFIISALFFLPRIKIRSADFAIWLILIPYFIFELLQNASFPFMVRVRDLIPFLYLLFVPLLREPMRILGNRRIFQYLRIATLGHALWAIPASLGILKPIEIGGIFMAPVFSTRWDHTGFALAVGLIVWYQHEAIEMKGSGFVLVIILLAAILQGSRAGLLACLFSLLAIAISFFSSVKESKSLIQRKFKFIPFLAASTIVLILLFPMFSRFIPENSSLSRIGIVQISERAVAGGQGTARGRDNAQQRLMAWVETQNRRLIGVGPGVEMISESGAVSSLSGSLDVRSPHSWLYGSLARFGFLGLFMWSLILYLARLSEKDALNPFKFPNCLVISLLITAAFGVMIESPFGSLPLAFLLAMPPNTPSREI